MIGEVKMEQRDILENFDNERLIFQGVFERYGIKSNWHGYPEKTILLKEIKECSTNQVVADHLWFNYTKNFQNAGNLEKGVVIEFMARVSMYKKGYWGYNIEKQIENPPRWDWKLNRPTKIKII